MSKSLVLTASGQLQTKEVTYPSTKTAELYRITLTRTNGIISSVEVS